MPPSAGQHHFLQFPEVLYPDDSVKPKVKRGGAGSLVSCVGTSSSPNLHLCPSVLPGICPAPWLPRARCPGSLMSTRFLVGPLGGFQAFQEVMGFCPHRRTQEAAQNPAQSAALYCVTKRRISRFKKFKQRTFHNLKLFCPCPVFIN